MNINITETPFNPEDGRTQEQFNSDRERQRLELHLKMLGLSDQEVVITMSFVDRYVSYRLEESETDHRRWG